jgi:hypothetical protein
MIGSEQRMTTNNNRSRAVQARDAALRRLRRTRRWVIAGTAALTAGFAALVSAVAPGRSLASKSEVRTEASTGASSSSSSARSAASAVPQLPPAANPDSLGLQRPSQPPQSVPSQQQNSTPPQSSTPPQNSVPPQSTPPASTPQSAPAPQSSGGSGVVSGGS